jgi:uncharacterized protein (DUF1330 family)
LEVKNAVLPNKQQINEFFDPDDGAPIAMVNLLKYRDKAEYADGRETELTGREAYMIYSEGVKKCLAKIGGSVSFMGEVRRLMLGEVEELWDDVAIANYPSRSAMLEMMQLPEMAEIGQHREAGLKGQLNIETIAGEF